MAELGRAELAALCILASSCGAVAPPSAPPFAGGPAGVAVEPREVVAAPSVVAPVALVEPVSPPRPAVTVEAPFRLDRRVFPTSRELFLAELRDRTRWNKGDMGKLDGDPPAVPGHPAPKVILEVTQAKGPLSAADAQRVLRERFWIKAVECFSLGAYKNQSLRGVATLSAGVAASGTVTGARVRESTFGDADVDDCLGDRLRKMTLPKARAGTKLSLKLQIGHGDEPVQPPEKLAVAGEGELAPDAIVRAVGASLPAFEACYTVALAYAPELWGRLGIRFHVTDKGKTDEAFETESTFPDERVRLCVLHAARKIAFPKPAGGDLRFVVALRFRTDRSSVPP